MSSFVQIFYDPQAVFNKVREKGAWLAPYLAIMLLTVAAAYFITHTIGMENLTRRFFDEHQSMAQQMGPEKLEQAIHDSNTPTRVLVGAISAGLFVGIATLIIAGILNVMLAMMDRKVRFPQMLGTVAWAGFPFSIVGVAMSVLVLSLTKDPGELDPAALLSTNPAAFMEKNSVSGFVFSLLRSFDLLTIGQILLLSFGISKVAGVTFGRALFLTGSLWILWILLRAGVYSAFGF